MSPTFATHHRRILEELAELTAHSEGFTLCVVTHCTGSTYRKVGAMVVVKTDGSQCGVISGGCLEPDLGSAAIAALRSGKPRITTVDTRTDHDLIFGSGSGCRGRTQVLLLPVAAGSRHPLVEALLAADNTHSTLKVVLITDGPDVGGGFIWSQDREAMFAPSVEAARALRHRPPGEYPVADGSVGTVLLLSPTPRLLLVGAGPEIPALISTVRLLGWRVFVTDHRKRLLDERAAGADRIIAGRPKEALEALDNEPLDACIVMTHTASNDREALSALAGMGVPFIGLLICNDLSSSRVFNGFIFGARSSTKGQRPEQRVSTVDHSDIRGSKPQPRHHNRDSSGAASD
jgi:xanthine dehydrogenase accessory factor